MGLLLADWLVKGWDIDKYHPYQVCVCGFSRVAVCTVTCTVGGRHYCQVQKLGTALYNVFWETYVFWSLWL